MKVTNFVGGLICLLAMGIYWFFVPAQFWMDSSNTGDLIMSVVLGCVLTVWLYVLILDLWFKKTVGS